MQQHCYAQCSSIISSFPYDENFENSGGNWTAIPSTEWQWGTPTLSKHVLTYPYYGEKCWIVGGLTTSSYASGNSELRSPCFDFSALTNPEISFTVFWETERRYDGATFQYSIDGGNNFTTLGSVTSNNTCPNANWYTYTPIDYLNDEPGWSGNVQGSGGGGNNCLYGLGSATWVRAKHSMSMLAGKPNVIFRFLFGAGTQCNDFDGFAVDNIHIAEAPPPGIADFSYICLGNDKMEFINHSASCNIQWDFGDPASGSDNTSTAQSQVHIFSTPGQSYNVTLTANFGTNTDIKTITVYTVNAQVHTLTNNICHGDTNLSMAVDNAIGGPTNTYQYTWSSDGLSTGVLPFPPTAAMVNNLPASPNGSYFVEVSSPGACSAKYNVGTMDPPVLNVSTTASPAKCSSDNGIIDAVVSGGFAPYYYSWNGNPFQSSVTSITNLAPGHYSLQVKDNGGCIKNINDIEIQHLTYPVSVSLGSNKILCTGETFRLDPGPFASYLWQDNSTAPVYTATHTGEYAVTVADNEGCTGSASVKIDIVKCVDIYFPSAFSPNADVLNDGFGPVGEVAGVEQYDFKIYNRYGSIVFKSTDPYKKWDGTINGQPQDTQNFVWIAKYNIRGKKPVIKKGSVFIIR